MQSAFIIPEEELRVRAKVDGITHLSTGVAVVRDGMILVVRRAPDDFLGGSYELPGGGVDAGETLEDAVARELLEETGIVLPRIVAMFPGFDYSTPTKPHVRQLNFIVKAEDYNATLSKEHDAFTWIDEDELDTIETTGPMKQCLRAALYAAK